MVVPSQVVSVPDSANGDYLLTFLANVPAAGFSTYYVRSTYVGRGNDSPPVDDCTLTP